jgi:hypothetical protein
MAYLSTSEIKLDIRCVYVPPFGYSVIMRGLCTNEQQHPLVHAALQTFSFTLTVAKL